jgi:hypothetical protein
LYAQPNASQLARAPGAVRSKGFIRERIKLDSLGVALDRRVKLLRIERFEPHAKPRQLARGKLFDGFLDVFGRGHDENIGSRCAADDAGLIRPTSYGYCSSLIWPLLSTMRDTSLPFLTALNDWIFPAGMARICE